MLRPDGIGTIVFASKTTASWEAILKAVVDAGWIITGSWPIDTEMETRVSRARSSARSHPPSISSAARAKIPTARCARTKSAIGATCCRRCPAAFTNGCRVWPRKASSARMPFSPVSARPWKFSPAIRAWKKPMAKPSRSRNTWNKSGPPSPRKRWPWSSKTRTPPGLKKTRGSPPCGSGR